MAIQLSILLRTVFILAACTLLTSCEEVTHIHVHAPSELTGAKLYLDGQLQSQMEVQRAGDRDESVGEVTYSAYWNPVVIRIDKFGYQPVVIRTRYEGWGHRHVSVPRRFVVKNGSPTRR